MDKSRTAIIYLLLISIAATASYLVPIDLLQSDLARHLKVGEIILKNGSIFNHNLFSYTQPLQAYINHNWLSAVIYRLLYSVWDFQGLTVVNTLLAVMSVILTALIAKKYSSWQAVFVSVVVFLPFISLRSEVRPEIFSMVLLPLQYHLLDRYRKSNNGGKLDLFLMAIIFLLWINLHSYFILGLALTALFSIKLLLEKRYRKALFLIFNYFVAVLLVIMIVPAGWMLIFYPIGAAFTNYMVVIDELLPIWAAFTAFELLIYLVMLLLGLISYLVAYFKGQKMDHVLPTFLFLLFLLSIRVNRFLSIYYLFAIISFALLLENYFSNKKIQNIFLAISFLLFGATIFKPLFSNDYLLGLRGDIRTDYQFLSSYRAQSPIFNEFETGNLLIHSWYPKTKVFIDGRPEAYSRDFLEQYRNYLTEWEQLNDKYRFQTIVYYLPVLFSKD